MRYTSAVDPAFAPLSPSEASDTLTPPSITPSPTLPKPLGYEPAVARPASKWLVVALLWFIFFLNYRDRQALFSVFPKPPKEFGFSKPQPGLIPSPFIW